MRSIGCLRRILRLLLHTYCQRTGNKCCQKHGQKCNWIIITVGLQRKIRHSKKIIKGQYAEHRGNKPVNPPGCCHRYKQHANNISHNNIGFRQIYLLKKHSCARCRCQKQNAFCNIANPGNSFPSVPLRHHTSSSAPLISFITITRFSHRRNPVFRPICSTDIKLSLKSGILIKFPFSYL